MSVIVKNNGSDVSLAQPLIIIIIITLRCLEPCLPVGKIVGFKLPRNKRNFPDGEKRR